MRELLSSLSVMIFCSSLLFFLAKFENVREFITITGSREQSQRLEGLKPIAVTHTHGVSFRTIKELILLAVLYEHLKHTTRETL